MKRNIVYMCIFSYITLYERACGEINEICDVEEGSGIHDCSPDEHCCEQSKCDILSKTILEPDKRCCDDEERKLHPPPEHCIRCKRCCNDMEMAEVPFPQECSKCSSCIKAAPEINFPTSRLPVGITNTAKSVDIGPSKNTRVITNGNTTNEKGENTTYTKTKASDSSPSKETDIIGLVLFISGFGVLIIGIITLFCISRIYN